MIYINYYSKMRTKIGMSAEEFDKERQYNLNRIATKVVPDNTPMRVQPLIYKMHEKTQVMIEQYIANHSENLSRVCFVGDHKCFNDYYFDMKNMYRSFQIPKHSGGFRTINAPDDELKELQKSIMKMYTGKGKFLAHNAAHGFTKFRNCKTSLEVHQAHGSRWFLKLDIQDFFPSTTFEQVYDALAHVYPFNTMTNLQRYYLTCVCCAEGVCPQGAPTSPMITNIVMEANDVAITKYCKEHNLIYTRYADDILISSRIQFDWEGTQRDIANILNHYTLKTAKTRYGSFNGRNWNLGLMYNNEGKITVGHAKKKLVKNMLHNYINKEEHDEHEYQKLLGIISYCAYIEPDYFNKYLETIKSYR